MINRLKGKKVFLAGAAIAMVLIVTVAWFGFIGPLRESSNDLHTRAAETRAQNASLLSKVSTLKQKSKLLAQYTASLKSASAALPADSGLPAFTRQLSSHARADSVQMSAIVVGGISAVTATASSAPAPTTDSSTDSSAPAPTTSTPASAAGGLFEIQVTVTSTGTMTHQLAFLSDIRITGPRRALITSVQITPAAAATAAASTSTVTLTSQLTIFSAPRSSAEIAELKKLLSGNIGN